MGRDVFPRRERDRHPRDGLHQTALVGHVDAWDPETASRLKRWTAHFLGQGDDSFTAARRALAALYRGTVEQAQALTYVEEFYLLSVIFVVALGLLPFMPRVRAEPARRERPAIDPLPAPTD